jgi:hypothetical protein
MCLLCVILLVFLTWSRVRSPSACVYPVSSPSLLTCDDDDDDDCINVCNTEQVTSVATNVTRVWISDKIL